MKTFTDAEFEEVLHMIREQKFSDIPTKIFGDILDKAILGLNHINFENDRFRINLGKLMNLIIRTTTEEQMRRLIKNCDTRVVSIIMKQDSFKRKYRNNLVEMIISTENPMFISKCIAESTIELTTSKKVELFRELERIKKEKNLDESLRPVEDKKQRTTLNITPEEHLAMSIYEGATPGRKTEVRPLGKNTIAYNMLNTMFFDGIETEITRVCDDNRKLIPECVLFPEELMEVNLNLYSAMCKFATKFHQEFDLTYRVERLDTFQKMEKDKKTISNLSTSLEEYNYSFLKRKSILMAVQIMPGTPCIEFADALALGNNYQNNDEAEVLIAPGCKFEVIGEIPLVGELNVSRVERKVKVRISPPDSPELLTEDEERDKIEQTNKYRDVELRAKAFEFLSWLNTRHGISTNLEGELQDRGADSYLEWKKAFQTVLRYRMREIALDIEKKVEQQKEGAYSMQDITKIAQCLTEEEVRNVEKSSISEQKQSSAR